MLLATLFSRRSTNNFESWIMIQDSSFLIEKGKMIIGVPKEIKEMENRVGATPAGVNELTRIGNQVLVEAGAGAGSGFADEAYRDAGATITDNVREVWGAEMVYKVKEPLEDEYGYFRSDLMLFTYLHLAAEGPLTKALVDNKVNSVAYETVQLEDGSLPLLTPMSEVAGRMAVQVGARFLEKPQGGQGVLLGGVPGVQAAMVVIIGGGVVGINSAKMAAGIGARVTILDVSEKPGNFSDGSLKILGLSATLAGFSEIMRPAPWRISQRTWSRNWPGRTCPVLARRQVLRP